MLDEPKAISIFKQIISALEYIHEKNICHRDLKLENVLIDDKGKIKIIDFGLSKRVEDHKKLATFCGSWSYCSPEVAQQNDYDGYANDRWSLGVLLFALVSGCLPFDDPDDNRYKTLHSIIHQPLLCPEHLSESCEDFLSKILDKDPTTRMSFSQMRRHKFMRMMSFQHMSQRYKNDRANRITN